MIRIPCFKIFGGGQMVPLLVYAPVSGKLYRKTECLQYLDENATRVLHYIHILRKKKFREALIIF